MVRKVLEEIPEETLKEDLEKYRQKALELGATDIKIIRTDMILIDERVRMKCFFPRCRQYGVNASCPPYAPDLELIRKAVSNFQYGIFVMLRVPPEQMAGAEAKKTLLYARSAKKVFEIVSEIEAEAFYDGYHLALGFASGPCKNVFCPGTECSAIVPGQPCRFSLKARASMEGVGMDAFTMAAKVGWDVYPIGASTMPSDVPHGTRLGLVLIY